MAAWRDVPAWRRDSVTRHCTSLITSTTSSAPLVAMTVAAEATSTLCVGSLVLDNDFRHPVVLAKEIATLGLAAEGRVEVGWVQGGSGSDYEASGIDFDDAGVRVERLAESLTSHEGAVDAGATTFAGRHYTVRGARCDPRPTAPPRVSSSGGERAGARPSGPGGGHRRDKHQSAFRRVRRGPGHHGHPRSLRPLLRLGTQAAGDRFGASSFKSGLQRDGRTQPQGGSAQRRLLGLAGEDVLDLPIVLIGTVEEICDRLLERRERWGFSNVVVPAEAIETFAPVVARLAGT